MLIIIWTQYVAIDPIINVEKKPTKYPARLNAFGMAKIPVPSALFNRCTNVSVFLQSKVDENQKSRVFWNVTKTKTIDITLYDALTITDVPLVDAYMDRILCQFDNHFGLSPMIPAGSLLFCHRRHCHCFFHHRWRTHYLYRSPCSYWWCLTLDANDCICTQLYLCECYNWKYHVYRKFDNGNELTSNFQFVYCTWLLNSGKCKFVLQSIWLHFFSPNSVNAK